MSSNQKILAIIVAAGNGKRMGSSVPKQYLPLNPEQTILEATLEKFSSIRVISSLYVAVSPNDQRIESMRLFGARVLKTGGSTREETVFKSLEALQNEVSDHSLVLVHDAARPLVEVNDIETLIKEASKTIEQNTAAGAVLGFPVSDTVKRVENGLITDDVDRTGLVRIATPQVFPFGVLFPALEKHLDATDESSAVRAEGMNVLTVLSSPRNFKITDANDLALAQKLSQRVNLPENLRLGLGYDSHRLVPGRDLILGGVKIPFEKGLMGHSDADVLIHAIIDALLGAAHLGNIGILFPDSDPAYKGADSCELLKLVHQKIRAAGYEILNIDSVIIAEKPKLNPHVPAICEKIASLLSLNVNQVSVKPKTNEKMGIEGQGLGMSTQAIALLQKVSH